METLKRRDEESAGLGDIANFIAVTAMSAEDDTGAINRWSSPRKMPGSLIRGLGS